MVSAMIVVAPPAVHPRIASLLGDSVELKFIPHTAIKQQGPLTAPSDWADRAYLELPDAQEEFPTSLLAELRRVLKKGSKICVRHRKGEAQKSWMDQLIFAGFVDGVESEGDGIMFETVAAKPPWDTAAAIPLKRKAKTANNNTPAPAPAPANGAKKVWTISAGDDEEDLMDEDSLLNEEDLKPQPKKEVKESDCSTSRKACKNCSCGRAEMEAEGGEEGTGTKANAAPTSACGNCYLGDAFRCAGCPYKGQPPFKPGDKVKIDLD